MGGQGCERWLLRMYVDCRSTIKSLTLSTDGVKEPNSTFKNSFRHFSKAGTRLVIFGGTWIMKELIVPHESQEAELVLGGFQQVDAKRQVNVDV